MLANESWLSWQGRPGRMFAGTLQCKHVLAISLSLSAYVLPLTPAYTRGPLIMSQSLILADWCLARPIGAYLQFDNVKLTLTVADSRASGPSSRLGCVPSTDVLFACGSAHIASSQDSQSKNSLHVYQTSKVIVLPSCCPSDHTRTTFDATTQCTLDDALLHQCHLAKASI